MRPQICERGEGDDNLPLLLWRFTAPARTISSGPRGGGIGIRSWAMNAQVPSSYSRHDPDRHLFEIARSLRLTGSGVGMLTAADVRAHQVATDGGVSAVATVGLGKPTLAAAPEETEPAEAVGTINIVAFVPAHLCDAALVNAVATATEAKAQALFEAGIAGTGTATDALCIACASDGPPVPFAGPRSAWGARLARAVHAAVAAGTGR